MSWLLNFVYLLTLVVKLRWKWGSILTRQPLRRRLVYRVRGIVPLRSGDETCVWIHAVSVGEVNLLATVVEPLLERRPGLTLWISASTETGYQLATEKYGDHTVFYCPFDFTWAMKRAFRRIRPDLVLLAELELWPNMVRIAHRQQVPVGVFNGRLSESSFRGYRRARVLRPTFRRLAFIGAQNQEYANRFVECGCPPDRVVVTGNVKFDGVETDRDHPQTRLLRQLLGDGDPFVFVAGSTQPEEDTVAIEVLQRLRNRIPNLQLIIVPRHLERVPGIVAKLQTAKLPYRLRSGIGAEALKLTANEVGPGEGVCSSGPSVLVVDVIGELSFWWGTADAAYVGGSMGTRGGQNMMEPAGFAVPVSFGPNTKNFRSVVDQLLAERAAVVVRDADKLAEFVFRCWNDPEWAQSLALRAQNLVIGQQGAARRTVEMLLTYLPADFSAAQNEAA